MPSFLFGGRSGGDLLISGFPWSGRLVPQGGIQIELDSRASGSIYVSLSGGCTIRSGGFFQSGGGMRDGMELTAGKSYWIPRIGTGLSGQISVYVAGDDACSGQARIFYEVF